MKKELTIDFSISSVKKAIKELKAIENKIQFINDEFMRESMEWIQNEATKNLEKNSKYQGTTDINSSWVISRMQPQKGGELAYEIRNNSPFSALVEFGTGRVGRDYYHPMATVVGYEYGRKSWSFVRDLTSNEWTVHSDVSNEEIKANPDKYLVLYDFDGYVGKSYLYDAFYSYFYLGMWKTIYNRVFSRYIK